MCVVFKSSLRDADDQMARELFCMSTIISDNNFSS
jgi:hypothetical protein